MLLGLTTLPHSILEETITRIHRRQVPALPLLLLLILGLILRLVLIPVARYVIQQEYVVSTAYDLPPEQFQPQDYIPCLLFSTALDF